MATLGRHCYQRDTRHPRDESGKVDCTKGNGKFKPQKPNGGSQ
jgi:hypothetical protein